jgi:hypothetical protein
VSVAQLWIVRQVAAYGTFENHRIHVVDFGFTARVETSIQCVDTRDASRIQNRVRADRRRVLGRAALRGTVVRSDYADWFGPDLASPSGRCCWRISWRNLLTGLRVVYPDTRYEAWARAVCSDLVWCCIISIHTR